MRSCKYSVSDYLGASVAGFYGERRTGDAVRRSVGEVFAVPTLSVRLEPFRYRKWPGDMLLWRSEFARWHSRKAVSRRISTRLRRWFRRSSGRLQLDFAPCRLAGRFVGLVAFFGQPEPPSRCAGAEVEAVSARLYGPVCREGSLRRLEGRLMAAQSDSAIGGLCFRACDLLALSLSGVGLSPLPPKSSSSIASPSTPPPHLGGSGSAPRVLCALKLALSGWYGMLPPFRECIKRDSPYPILFLRPGPPEDLGSFSFTFLLFSPHLRLVNAQDELHAQRRLCYPSQASLISQRHVERSRRRYWRFSGTRALQCNVFDGSWRSADAISRASRQLDPLSAPFSHLLFGANGLQSHRRQVDLRGWDYWICSVQRLFVPGELGSLTAARRSAADFLGRAEQPLWHRVVHLPRQRFVWVECWTLLVRRGGNYDRLYVLELLMK